MIFKYINFQELRRKFTYQRKLCFLGSKKLEVFCEMKGMKVLFFALILSFLVASLWNTVPAIKETVHFILDPSFGKLLSWNLIIGFLIITIVMSLVFTLVQKYGTDQESLKEIKKKQKDAQREMKKYRDDPTKALELSKKSMEDMPKIFEITMKPLLYTSIPIVLFFRWFSETLSPAWGGWWILYYLLASMIFGSVIRKVMKVA